MNVYVGVTMRPSQYYACTMYVATDKMSVNHLSLRKFSVKADNCENSNGAC